jgi:hypothetical protein
MTQHDAHVFDWALWIVDRTDPRSLILIWRYLLDL